MYWEYFFKLWTTEWSTLHTELQTELWGWELCTAHKGHMNEWKGWHAFVLIPETRHSVWFPRWTKRQSAVLIWVSQHPAHAPNHARHQPRNVMWEPLGHFSTSINELTPFYVLFSHLCNRFGGTQFGLQQLFAMGYTAPATKTTENQPRRRTGKLICYKTHGAVSQNKPKWYDSWQMFQHWSCCIQTHFANLAYNQHSHRINYKAL